MSSGADVSAVAVRHRVTALLGLLVEATLSGTAPPVPLRELVASPWDAWWACYRASCPPPADLRRSVARSGSCPRCTRQVGLLLDGSALAHPQQLPEAACGCLRSWAVAMRQPVPAVDWPAHRVSVALTKPGSASARTVDLLRAQGCTVVETRTTRLGAGDVRRLYPEAYGARFVREQDGYLASAPCRVVVLLLPPQRGLDIVALKRSVRTALGDADVLRNHVHMPDNPADALCDLLHLAGATVTEALYDQHERHRSHERADGYRRVVERPGSRARAR